MLRRRRPQPDTPPPEDAEATPGVPSAAPVRWTADAEPPRDAPADDAPSPTTPPAEVVPNRSIAPRPSDVPVVTPARTGEVAAPAVSLSMPDVPSDVPDGVPAAYVATPAGAAPPAAEDEAPAEDVDAVRARLAAGGLVRTSPMVRIRDLAGGRPEADAAPVTPRKGDGFDPPRVGDEPASGDAEALEPEPVGPTAVTRCPSCRSSQNVAIDATGFRCGTCDKVWRWGVCTTCSRLSLTIARQESWRCADCGAYSRSWWRTATAPRDAQEVTRRKRAEATERERRRVLEVARRRRWKVLVAGAVVVVAAGIGAVVFSSTDAGSPVEQTRATCASWDQLRSAIANGSVADGALDSALTDLAAGAEDATPDVQLAVDAVADAGRPGTAEFLVASTELSDACAAAR